MSEIIAPVPDVNDQQALAGFLLEVREAIKRLGEAVDALEAFH